ncbi:MULTISPECIES: type IX secretion system protein PorG [Empedobacter]|uniref:type IX secretion system protein PorG n=1 Tax=Empedobacter TaxID=59734 RepID=UPI00289F662D|nr:MULTISPECIES: DUF6089 family protein [Empedobacter]
MMRLFLFVFTLCLSQMIFAQRHELGIFAGGANVIGDVGKASYINPFPTKTEPGGKIFLPISIGGLYRFNINPQMGFRANISYSKVGASDHRSKEQYKLDRNKNFRNNIVEGSVMFEYNFFSINDDQEKAQSPYIFIGVGAFSAKGKEYDYDADSDLIIEKTKYNTDLTIPFGVGYKVRFNYNWILSFETGVRYANVDYLDYNTGKFSDRFNEAIADGTLPKSEFDKRQFGNMSSKDWYVLSGITLTYSFGRPACYCD